MTAASDFRKLNWYPAIKIAIGSPNGAMRVTSTTSPGMQPISISFNEAS